MKDTATVADRNVKTINARNPDRLWQLLNEGWLKDLSEKNRAIYDHPGQKGLCYDAEKDLYYVEEDNGPLTVCTCCNRIYAVKDEDQKVTAAKVRICPHCYKQ